MSQAEKLTGTIDKAASIVDEHAKELQERAAGLRDRAADFVRENPVACVAGAFVIGFALAKAARYA